MSRSLLMMSVAAFLAVALLSTGAAAQDDQAGVLPESVDETPDNEPI